MRARATSESVFTSKQLDTRPLDIPQVDQLLSIGMAKGANTDKLDILQGTLDLMILKTLDALGPLHGFAIARRLEQVGAGALQLNEGTVYTSLLRLQDQGWITSAWGASENNRKAKFYSVTKRGRAQLAREAHDWRRMASIIARILALDH